MSLRQGLIAVAVLAVVGAIIGLRKLVVARAASASTNASPSVSRLGFVVDVDPAVLHVPYLPGSIVLDGDTDDPGWTRSPGPARTGDFLAPNGAPAIPFSEVRVVWGDAHLYLCLYASDDDIESRTDQPDGPLWLDDDFVVTFSRGATEYIIEVSPKAVVTDSIRRNAGPQDFSWNSGVHVSREVDGTINDPRDSDEEWVIEMAVPFESIGMKGERGETLGFSVRRCDTPRRHVPGFAGAWSTREGEVRTCGEWGEAPSSGRIVLD